MQHVRAVGVQIQAKVRQTGYEVDINGSCWASKPDINRLGGREQPEPDFSGESQSSNDPRPSFGPEAIRAHGKTAEGWQTSGRGDEDLPMSSDVEIADDKNANSKKNTIGVDAEPCLSTKTVEGSARVEGHNGTGGKSRFQRGEKDDGNDGKGTFFASKSDGRAAADSERFESGCGRRRGRRRRRSWQDYYSSEEDDQRQSWTGPFSDERDDEDENVEGLLGRDGWTRCHEDNYSRSPSPGMPMCCFVVIATIYGSHSRSHEQDYERQVSICSRSYSRVPPI